MAKKSEHGTRRHGGLKPGDAVTTPDGIAATVVEVLPDGLVRVRFVGQSFGIYAAEILASEPHPIEEPEGSETWQS